MDNTLVGDKGGNYGDNLQMVVGDKNVVASCARGEMVDGENRQTSAHMMDAIAEARKIGGGMKEVLAHPYEDEKGACYYHDMAAHGMRGEDDLD